jgi:hypothetical protein
LERLEAAKELHTRALRTENPKQWHALRIGLKRFRYTVAGLLPAHYSAWIEHLKRLQDTLGELHDLDVLAEAIKHHTDAYAEEAAIFWTELLARKRRECMETYRRLTLGKTSYWNEWRNGLPHNGRLESASLARLFATARSADNRPRRSSRNARIAIAIFEALRRLKAAPIFSDSAMHRILRAASRLYVLGAGAKSGSPQKAARRLLLKMNVPPGWSAKEWEILAWTVRYHRGTEPKTGSGAFSRIEAGDQKTVCALAGVLRLARVLGKSGIETGSGIRAENSGAAILLKIPNLNDSAELAAQFALGKHLLESSLEMPVVLKSTPKPEKVVALTSLRQQSIIPSAAASD